ncbi:sugar ABC transporter permease [Actinocatenispora thailandica]|uniref:Sugar ABC transporter permease n=1 Tax=Actinocatenispora thailandica TaxID=227318 RepID=A0A7R7DPT9_9ACTN|nr:carbohydrate ABC transporter permease [Actinocatenispora thailandica]BCJ35461.1 sugar ABC transporter permease [Actinocatenispora thailandica]
MRRILADALVRHALSRIGLYLFAGLMLVFFALPLLWLVLTPFSRTPAYQITAPSFTLHNFRVLFDNPFALRSIGNSLVLAGGTAVLAVVFAGTAAYALSRVRLPGRDALLYAILLLSSIVTGTAAMVPIFLMLFQLNMIDNRLALILVLTGGLLPSAMFILKDFMDSVPKSYEESARVFGASPLQILRHVVAPVVRPGLATIAVWAVVQVWGNFLLPYILLHDQAKQPAAVIMYTFYDEGGQPNFALISTFSLLYSVPVVVAYLIVNRRYGFRFQGGIKG